MRNAKMLLLNITTVMLVSSLAFAAQDKTLAVDSALDRVERRSTDLAAVAEETAVGVVNVQAPPAAPKTPITEIVKTIDVKDMPLEDALESISAQTGIVFIMPETLPGKVTVSLQNVNVWDLLNIILQQHGLAYHKTNGAVHIMDQGLFRERYGYDFVEGLPAKMVTVRYVSLETLLPMLDVAKSAKGKIWIDTKNRQALMIDAEEKMSELEAVIREQDVLFEPREFVLQYISFDQVKERITAVLTPHTGQMQYDDAARVLRVTDSREKLDKIQAMLEEEDKEVLVPFDVKVVRISLNEEHAPGVDWEAIVSAYQRYRLGSSNTGSASEQMSIGTVTQEDYDVLVDALDTVGDLVSLIHYKIESSLNQEQHFDIDTNDPFWSMRPGAREGNADPAVLDPAGFEMRFNMRVKDKGKKFGIQFLPRLHWMEEEGDQAQARIFAGEMPLTLEVDKGDVIVIGGLIRTNEISRTRKFPVLGDLPMVGTVFRRQRTKFENIEYVIFLRPLVPSSIEGVPAGSAAVSK